MAVATAGLSSLGVRFGYGVETTPGVKPARFTWIERVNQISGLDLSTEQIDASALEDYTTRYIPGRQDTGGDWGVSFNFSDEVEAQLNTMIAAYNAGQQSATPLNTWFEVWSPNQANAFYVVAAPPKKLPMPEFGQNELQVIEVPFTITEYKGRDTAIKPVEGDVVNISVAPAFASVAEGSTVTLSATTSPAGETVTWESSDENVATVASGVVSGVAAGSAVITATAGGSSATCVITVTD